MPQVIYPKDHAHRLALLLRGHVLVRVEASWSMDAHLVVNALCAAACSATSGSVHAVIASSTATRDAKKFVNRINYHSEADLPKLIGAGDAVVVLGDEYTKRSVGVRSAPLLVVTSARVVSSAIVDSYDTVVSVEITGRANSLKLAFRVMKQPDGSAVDDGMLEIKVVYEPGPAPKPKPKTAPKLKPSGLLVAARAVLHELEHGNVVIASSPALKAAIADLKAEIADRPF